MTQFPYVFFDEYVCRTPLFSQKKFQNQFSKNEVFDSDIKEICSDSVFQEAIYLASPNVHREANERLNSEKQFSLKERQKLKHTLLKYYSRMSTRCTPFGLFSEIGLGIFNNENTIDSVLEKTRDTKLDMHFLTALSQKFTEKPEIRNRLLFFPNNSIYIVGNSIRYVEYQYSGLKREYIISSAPLSDELREILHVSKEGKTILQLAKTLVNEEISLEDASEFIEELIDNQVLVSELEPNVSGDDFLDRLIAVLKKRGVEKEASALLLLREKIQELDLNIGNPVSLYAEVEKIIQSLQTEYDQKYLFQTDLYSKNTHQLPHYWKKEIKKGISFLNKMSFLPKNTSLEKFKRAFNERYEGEEMPLSYVLDTELGIGYLQDIPQKGIHPYLEDLQLPPSKYNQELTITINPIQKILNEKLQEAIVNHQYCIELTDEDFKDVEENWNDLPNTISIMAEIISENNHEKMVINGGGGSSAANLLGRFCSEKSEVHNLTKTIVKKEEILRQAQYGNHEVLAEIIHLPEARIGNVIRRPTLRQYEIPYLAQSVVPEENQILIDDLFISVKNGRLVLRSKRLNKEVRPYLTNAHNYYTNSLPVYHFLSDLHSQNSRSGIHFSWGDLQQIYHFFPRVEYKNIILSKASWKITEKEFSEFSILLNDDKSNKEELLSKIKIWREKRRIPKWIQWVQSDNKLTMNLENYDLLKIFIETTLKLKSIIIEEFLYNENNDFKHEFIFPMYKNTNHQ